MICLPKMDEVRAIERQVLDCGGKIATMTLYFHFSSNIPIQSVISNSKLKVRLQQFNNSYTVDHWDTTCGKLCAKVFTNGFQMTGGKSYNNVACFMQSICDNLVVNVNRVDIQMINAVIHTGKELLLQELYDKCVRRDMTVSYDRDVYSGLKLKLEGVTLLWFSSGKVIIAGIKSKTALIHAYKSIHHLSKL